MALYLSPSRRWEGGVSREGGNWLPCVGFWKSWPIFFFCMCLILDEEDFICIYLLVILVYMRNVDFSQLLDYPSHFLVRVFLFLG